MTDSSTRNLFLTYEYDGCLHDFAWPLFSVKDDEWTDEIVGFACVKCYEQVFYSDVVLIS